MRLKQRVGDFRVRELIDPAYLGEQGEHKVYLVSKRKLTSTDAARELARAARVEPRSVGMAGLKDRQAATIQYMSVRGGHVVHLRTDELSIEPAGRAREAYSSRFSLGNAFDITVRDLAARELECLRQNLPAARAHGLPNYFDDQRFGNLRHDQGWIARELMLGRVEQALQLLLAAPSVFDDESTGRYKAQLRRHWGDWQACQRIARRLGTHRSVFERLIERPGDFGAAFSGVSTRLRLIHLYAWQSHLWNRAVSQGVVEATARAGRVHVDGIDGPLWCHAGEPPPGWEPGATFRLPGDGLQDVHDPRQLELLEDALAQHRLVADQYRIRGIEGFQLKGEDRPVLLVPRNVRARPASPDPLHAGRKLVQLRFELPRAAYATLVVKRLFADPEAQSERSWRPRAQASASGSAPSSPDRAARRDVARERGGRDRPGAEPGRRRRPRA